MEDVGKDEELTAKNIRIILLGGGLSSRYYNILPGNKVYRSVKRGVPMSWDLLG